MTWLLNLDAAHAGTVPQKRSPRLHADRQCGSPGGGSRKAIKADPRDAVPYFIKANGLLKKSGVDVTAKHFDLPAGCAEAYKKYLSLAPNGPYASEAEAVLRRAEKGTKAAK